MKHMKRAAALFLALIMIMSLAVTAFATAPTGKITVNKSSTVTLEGKTFKAYKVLDATMKDPQDPAKGISYTVPAEMKEFYATNLSIDQDAADFDTQVITAMKTKLDSADTKYKFAREILEAAKAAKITPETADTKTNDAHTFADLPLGYYVIEDEGSTTPISSVMLNTPNNSAKGVEITLKADKPAVDKKIDGNNDTDAGSSGDVSYNTAAVGDKVPFKISTAVPDMAGYTKYFFIVNDTLSKGLTFNNDVVITVDGKTLDSGKYEVTTTSVEGSTALKIVFKNFIEQAANKNKPIVITYTATVNQNAVIGVEGNTNKAVIRFSNNPNVTPKENHENPDEPHDDDKDKVSGETPSSETYTYVTGVKINKVDEADKALKGAKFKIEGTKLNTVLVKKGTFRQSGEGTYYKLKDGTYTTEASSPETADQYESTETKYARTENATPIIKADEVVYEGVVGEDGVLSFDGLGAGQYKITELEAPQGYHLLKDPMEITITCELPDADTAPKNCTWKVSGGTSSVADGIVTVKVVNKAGSVLPETGGMGTTTFFVVGSMLVMASAVLLIADKRRKQF